VEQRRVGGSGLRVSRLGLGTMMWGRDTDEHEAREQLADFVEAGGTLVDTASTYGGGASEQLLGALLGDVVERSEVVLCTKAGLRREDGERVVDASRRSLLGSLDTSLARLRTDHVDLFLVHAHDPGVPVQETLATLEHVVATGRARYVGVSNHNGWQLARAASLASPAAPLVADQVELSLLARQPEQDVLPAAAAVGAGVIGWSPLGRGVLTGKYRHGTPADSRAASEHFAGYVRPYLGARQARVVEAVVTAATGLDATPLEVALAWARDHEGVASVVVGARSAAQLRASLAADDLVLPEAIREALDDASAPPAA
jgi:aryl-alcohol dehydrogenase-like predicted oxidoreductase